MTAPIPIPVHPWPLSPERLELLKQAKASIQTHIKIVPVEAAVGMPTRVLSFGGRPPFITAWAPIRPENVDSVPSIAAALKFILGEVEGWHPDDHWGEAAWLSDVMGMDVKYSHSEDETGRVFWE